MSKRLTDRFLSFQLQSENSLCVIDIFYKYFFLGNIRREHHPTPPASKQSMQTDIQLPNLA